MDKVVNVIFPFLNKTVKINADSKVSDACAKVGQPLNLVCGGKGKCKKCIVDIEVEGKITSVISCQTKVVDGVKVLLKKEDVQAQILTDSVLNHIDANPSLALNYLSHEELKTELAGNNWETIEKHVKFPLHKPSLELIQKLSRVYHNEVGITLVRNNSTVIDVFQGKKEVIYALAFDIGSTSVVGYLYDMVTFQQIGISSRLNMQTQIGGDVISRIEHTMSQPHGLTTLQHLVRDTINQIILQLCQENKIEKNDIYGATFCGNSTMQHLFFGIYPEHLGIAPFTSTTHDEISTKASCLNIDINPNGQITFLPLLGGFVGADTTGVLLSLPSDSKSRLVIDLGTNGEIAVGKHLHYKVASTACGPALEGAGLEFGMRGTQGAIERFAIIDGKVSYKVIGNVKPQGICGSGIIDLVCELLVNGFINNRGAICDPSNIADPRLAERIIPWDQTKAFVVCFAEESESGKPILLTQKDIRQVQLAKGAIFTGCHMLIEHSGLTIDAIDEILIAGAFGNYIDIKKAQTIGMIPHCAGVPVNSIGNAAGTGCQMFLLSHEEQQKCKKIAENAIHVELATDPAFTTKYMSNTYFNKIDV
ncbi:MAG: ASKHA domain-containing protein [Eubacteriales bacterium]